MESIRISSFLGKKKYCSWLTSTAVKANPTLTPQILQDKLIESSMYYAKIKINQDFHAICVVTNYVTSGILKRGIFLL